MILACLLGSTGLASGTLPVHAATDLQGTIAVAGVGNSNLFCAPCTPSFPVATTGYLAGLDGTTPFSIAWGTPGVAPMPASLSMALVDNCATVEALPGPPNIESLTGTLVVNGAVLVYGTQTLTASVTAQFYTQPLAQPLIDPIPVIGLTLTAQSGSLSVTVNVAVAKGVLALVPAGLLLCPTPSTAPMNFALTGTLLTAG